MNFEIRQLDCYVYDDGWSENTSYHLGDMFTRSDDIPRALTAWLRNRLGIRFRKNRTRILYDGDCYEIVDRKTHEPLFIAIPKLAF